MSFGAILGIGKEPNYERQPRVSWQQFQAPINPVEQATRTTGISTPTNNGGYTVAEDGVTPIAVGQDGYGLAHRNPDEYDFHLIA